MAFDFYFTGVPANSDAADFILKKDACILLSQLNERNNIYKWIDRIKESNSKCKLFIDSGAFSAWTKGKAIDIDEYINFINTYKEYFTVCASVDSIPGEARTTYTATAEQVAESAKKTWDNFLYMRAKMDNPDILLCTFHCGESWEVLEKILSYQDEHGFIKYIAFGGLVGKSEAIIKTFFEKAFHIVKNSPNPNVNIHAFGMTRFSYLEEYPFTSADSTSWLQAAGYGNIIIGTKTIYLSDKQLLSDDNILNKNTALKEDIEKIIIKHGYTIEELAESSKKRLMFNVELSQEWADNYQMKGNDIYKASLW